MFARLLCWYFGHQPDIEAALYTHDYNTVPCARCGQALGYHEQVCQSRHGRVKDWLSYWLWRRWQTGRCCECGLPAPHIWGTPFLRSLRAHPGVPVGLIWMVLVAVSLLTRSDFDALPIGRVLLVIGAVGALPWPVILWTAWKRRAAYGAKCSPDCDGIPF